MADEKIKIYDESNDRNYFTIVPNYILNHSSAIDQALYLQMRRFAGERGLCYASYKTLTKQLGVTRNTLKNSINYLLSHGWIVEVGQKTVATAGGKQKTRSFRIVDLWKMNMDYYSKGGSKKDTPLEKGGQNEARKGGQNSAMKKNHVEEEPKEAGTAHAARDESNSLIVAVIDAFREVNPAFGGWYGNKTQRAAAKWLIEEYGLEETLKKIAYLSKLNEMAYAPTTTSPYELKQNMAKIRAFLLKSQNRLQTKGRGLA